MYRYKREEGGLVDVLESSSEVSARLGWLSPGGRLYPCRPGGHSDLADGLAATHAGVPRPISVGQGEDALEQLGWVKLAYGYGFRVSYLVLSGARPVTRAQSNYISQWCDLVGIPYPDTL